MRAVKMMSLTRAGPISAVRRLMFDIDRQLPSVRAIGKPNFAVCGADAQVAAGRDARAAAGAGAGDRGDRRHPAALEVAENPVDAGLVLERVLRRLEGAELRDVGAGRERLVAGAGEDHDLDRGIVVHLAADLGHALVHREGERIARLRPVEGDAGNPVADLIEEIGVYRRGRKLSGRGHHILGCFRSPAPLLMCARAGI